MEEVEDFLAGLPMNLAHLTPTFVDPKNGLKSFECLQAFGHLSNDTAMAQLTEMGLSRLDCSLVWEGIQQLV